MSDLDHLLDLHTTAAPGPYRPWCDGSLTVVRDHPDGDRLNGVVDVCTVEAHWGEGWANHEEAGDTARYIVAACNAVPDLVARVREQANLYGLALPVVTLDPATDEWAAARAALCDAMGLDNA